MPITKRLRVHQSAKGMQRCIEYVMNDNKTDGGVLVSGHNCNPEMAVYEFKQNNNQYDKLDDDLSCYHIVQSFDFRDNITPKEVNEIGIKLCEKLYPEFQCVVATHVDRGHLHNHIIINATNTKGRKLDDRLANPIEGLYGLRTESDRLALEYGCSIIHNPPKIGHFKSKNYVYQAATVNWKTTIKEKIDAYKLQCNSFEALLEMLTIDGYSIKGSKHVSIKPYGKERFTRMYTLGKGYTDDDLRDYYADRDREILKNINMNQEFPDIPESELYTIQKDIYTRSRAALLLSDKGRKEGKQYPNYRRTRYLEKQRYRNAIETLHFLNEEKIFNYDDLIARGRENENEIKSLEEQYTKLKSQLNTLNVPATLANTYIEHYNEYQNYLEIKKSMPEAQKDENIELFEDVKNQLGNASITDVRELLSESAKLKRDANQQLAKLSYLKRKQTIFEMLRTKSLEKDYVKHMSFSKKMIDESRSNENEYCVKLPYTKQYVYLSKECVAWTNYDVRAVMYLRDDDDYYLYDEENQIIGIAKGEELDDISQEERERIRTIKEDRSK